jgi:hypothetical protein
MAHNTPIHPDTRRRSVWLWAVLLVVLLLVAWLLSRFANQRRGAVVVQATALVADSGSTVGPDPVDAYLAFVGDARAATRMAPDHEFVAEAIGRLAAALEALAAPGATGVQRDVDALREQARALQRDARSTAHADSVRAAFVRLASLMSSVQAQQFPLHADNVALARQAAERIDADRPLLEQREAIQQFLDRSADTMRGMIDER